MTRKKLWIVIGIFIVLLSAIIYWSYFSKQATFPTNEQLVEEMNRVFPEARSSEIQDRIFVDEQHVVVPFISEKNDYGLSYWVWQKRKWRVASIDTKGRPMVWKVNQRDPSTFHFVWNIDPDDKLDSIQIFLIRDRGYGITEGKEYYDPRVQMDTKISLQDKTYGALGLPENWVAFLDAFGKVETAEQPDLFFSFPEPAMTFGWIPYDQEGKETFPEHSVNGSGFSNGDGDLEHVMIMDKGELERP
ncbi:hypothetical protein [Niallia sp. Krafla_26]|uniref:hypothetical protein n=1 Tax=Niallia sp. Krafla_26 TaxID=3064703 RepID=UPI003D174102